MKVTYKSLRLLLLEIVALGVVVGLIPELLVNGLKDAAGVCPFMYEQNDVCTKLQIQGAIQLLFGAISVYVAGLLCLYASKEFNRSDQ